MRKSIMYKERNMTNFYKEIFAELRNIKSIDLAYKGANVLEKMLWILMSVIGATWVVYFISSWDDDASVLIQGDSNTLELKYPAVTICPKVSTKYAIAERLGNYIDPMNLPKELLSLRQDFLLCATGLIKKLPSYKSFKEWYTYYCGGLPLRRNACKVSRQSTTNIFS